MKLATKITLMLVFVSLVPLLILGAVAAYSINGIRDKAMDVGMRMLMDAERANLAQLAEESAFGINQFCKAYYDDVLGLRAQYDVVRGHPERFADGYREDLYPDKPHPGLPGYGYVHPAWGMYGDFDRRSPTTSYARKSVVERAAGDAGFASELSSSLRAAKLMEAAFVFLAGKYPETLDLVWIVTTDGAANVCPPYDLGALIAKDPALPDLNESENVYVRLLDPAHNPGRAVRWLQPYLDPYKRIWITSCIAPLYDGDTFLGSMGMDILLSTIREKVLHIGIGSSGYAFLIDSKGLPIALPPPGIEDLAWGEAQKKALAEIFGEGSAQGAAHANIDTLATTALGMSPRPEVARLIGEMTAQKAGVARLALSGEQKLVAYAPIRNPGWSLGLVFPVKEALAPAMRASQTIGEGTQRIRFNFMLVLIGVAAFSVSLGWVTKHQLTPQVRRLMGLMLNVSEGKLDPSNLRTGGSDEFSQIERSLAEMHSLLDEKERRLTSYAVNLETLIQERTEALRKTQEELVQKEKLNVLGRLAEGLEHEFRTPLAEIAASVRALRSAHGAGKDAGERIEAISSSVRNAERMLSDLLDLSRTAPGEKERVNASALAEEALKECPPPRGVAAVNRVPSDAPAVFADRRQIGRALVNLLSNAYHAMSRGGELGVSARAEGRFLRLSVSDTGCGMPADAIGRIFDPLFTTRAGALGLGLSACRNLVEINGGRVEAESKPGAGSTITLVLPLAGDGSGTKG